MSEAVYDEAQDALHRAARYSLPAFAVKLLGDIPPRGSGTPLPLGVPSALTQEALEAVTGVIRAGVWRFLARGIGWRKLHVVDPAAGKAVWARLWNLHSPAVKFSTGSIELILRLYNSTREDTTMHPDDGRMWENPTGGDLLLQHIAFRNLRTNPILAGIPMKYDWSAWSTNPLNVAYDPRIGIADGLARLTEVDLASFLPWLCLDWATHWENSRETAWVDGGGEPQRIWNTALAALIPTLAECFQNCGRDDLLTPVAQFASNLSKRTQRERNRFNSVVSGLRHADRPRVSSPWAGMLLAIHDALSTCWRAALDTHPIERTQEAKRFLAACEELNLTNALDSLLTLRQHLQPTLS